MSVIRTASVAVVFAASGLACAVDQVSDRALPEVEFTITRVIALDSLGTDARDVVVMSDRLWVLTDHDPFISVFDTTGTLVARFGQRGRGPRDLLAPWALTVAERDSAPWIYDAGKHAVLQIPARSLQARSTALRTVLGSVRSDFREVTYGNVATVFRSSKGFVAAAYRGDGTTTRSLLFPSLVSYSEEGTPLDTLIDFLRSPPDTAGLGRSLDLVPIPLFANCSPDTVVFFDGYSDVLESVSLEGNRRRFSRLPIALASPRASTRDERFAYFLGQLSMEVVGNSNPPDVSALASQMARAEPSRFTPMLPRITRMSCGPNGSVLIQGFGLTTSKVGYGTDWYLVGPDGAGFMKVKMPEGFVPRTARGGELVGLLIDSVGRASIAFTAAHPAPR